MRKLVWAVWTTAALLLGVSDPLMSKTLNLSKWSYMAPVEVTGSGAHGAVQFTLSPKVIDLSLPSLKDLRLVQGKDDEIGYEVRQSKGKSRKVALKTKLFNRSYVTGREGSVTVDFGGSFLKNRVKITTNGKTFLRRVRIEGSEDRHAWKTVKNGAILFRAQEDDGRVQEKTVVNFPDNNQRYMRVTVFAGADDPEAIEISNVEAWQIQRSAPEIEAVPIVSVGTTERKRVTELSLDLGFRNMPLSNLKLAFSDKNFFRKVDVSGRNATVRVVRTVVEDSPKLEKSVPVPWTPITTGRIYRFSSGNTVEESLELNLRGAQYRYLRVRIKNRDDPPLRFTGASVDRFAQYVWFAGKSPGAYTLYFGNPKARLAEYDVGRFIGKLRRENISQATLGKVVPNPAHKPVRKTVPWSERHAGIIWIALLSMVAVLGLLIYRMARSKQSPVNPHDGAG